MIEAAVSGQGMTVQEWNAEDGRPVAVLGRYRATADDEDNGVFEDMEGVMTATVVGAAQYHNERVWFGWRKDGMDTAVEARDPMDFEPAFA